jgi:hypothetical protein
LVDTYNKYWMPVDTGSVELVKLLHNPEPSKEIKDVARGIELMAEIGKLWHRGVPGGEIMAEADVRELAFEIRELGTKRTDLVKKLVAEVGRRLPTLADLRSEASWPEYARRSVLPTAAYIVDVALSMTGETKWRCEDGDWQFALAKLVAHIAKVRVAKKRTYLSFSYRLRTIDQ